MDPVTIAIIGTLLGGFLIKGIETYLGRNSGGVSAIEPKDEFDPHHVRKMEIELFGWEWWDDFGTRCPCSNCKWADEGRKNAKGVKAVVDKVQKQLPSGVMKQDSNGVLTFHANTITAGTIHTGSGQVIRSDVPKFYKRRVNRFQFTLPTGEVPEDAHCAINEYDPHGDTVWGLFTWIDEFNGQKMWYRTRADRSPIDGLTAIFHQLNKEKPVEEFNYAGVEVDELLGHEFVRQKTNKRIMDEYYAKMNRKGTR